MKESAFLNVVSLICATSIFTVGCVVYPAGPPVATVGAEVEVGVAPPAPIYETVPPSPGVDFVWVGGYWVWQGSWVWERGVWCQPPHPGAVWVPHRYVVRNGRYVFVRGGWR